jgi:hypothetical protein
MTSTKMMFLGVLIMLLGLALGSLATVFVLLRASAVDAVTISAYVAVALFAIGFVVGVIGLFRQ